MPQWLCFVKLSNYSEITENLHVDPIAHKIATIIRSYGNPFLNKWRDQFVISETNEAWIYTSIHGYFVTWVMLRSHIMFNTYFTCKRKRNLWNIIALISIPQFYICNFPSHNACYFVMTTFCNKYIFDWSAIMYLSPHRCLNKFCRYEFIRLNSRNLNMIMITCATNELARQSVCHCTQNYDHNNYIFGWHGRCNAKLKVNIQFQYNK